MRQKQEREDDDNTHAKTEISRCLIVPGRKNLSNTGLPHRCMPRITFKPKK